MISANLKSNTTGFFLKFFRSGPEYSIAAFVRLFLQYVCTTTVQSAYFCTTNEQQHWNTQQHP